MLSYYNKILYVDSDDLIDFLLIILNNINLKCIFDKEVYFIINYLNKTISFPQLTKHEEYDLINYFKTLNLKIKCNIIKHPFYYCCCSF